jgi:hypothetical protein
MSLGARLVRRLAILPKFCGVALLCVIAGEIGLRFVPLPPALLRPPVQSIALLDRNGIPLREARVAERFSRELRLDKAQRHVIAAVQSTTIDGVKVQTRGVSRQAERALIADEVNLVSALP